MSNKMNEKSSVSSKKAITESSPNLCTGRPPTDVMIPDAV